MQHALVITNCLSTLHTIFSPAAIPLPTEDFYFQTMYLFVIYYMWEKTGGISFHWLVSDSTMSSSAIYFPVNDKVSFLFMSE